MGLTSHTYSLANSCKHRAPDREEADRGFQCHFLYLKIMGRIEKKKSLHFAAGATIAIVLAKRYNYWHSDPDSVLVHKQPEGTREHPSMHCSVIKGLDIVQTRCARVHAHVRACRENRASPGKHCPCSFASLELTHKEKTQPINNKQQHNHFCFRGHSAQDRKQRRSIR